MFAVTLLALLCSHWAPAAAQFGNLIHVSVPRCCPPTHALTPDVLHKDVLGAAEVPAACAPTPLELPWAPLVYAPARNAFLPRGRVPPHWRLEFSRVPSCTNLRVLSERDATLLAQSGHLMLRNGRKDGLPPERFCVDATTTLACAVNVLKCCDASLAFDGEHCAADESPRAEMEESELQQLNNDGVVGTGWPKCADGWQIAVVGDLSAGRLEAGGVLQLGNDRLEGGAWCAETRTNYSERVLQVFTCVIQAQEDAREMEVAQEHDVQWRHENARKREVAQEHEEKPKRKLERDNEEALKRELEREHENVRKREEAQELEKARKCEEVERENEKARKIEMKSARVVVQERDELRKCDYAPEREKTPTCMAWLALYIAVGIALIATALVAGFVCGRFYHRREALTRGAYIDVAKSETKYRNDLPLTF